MAIKKSELYSSLWQSCDQLRGGMDASQYKDYVLTLLFVKYVSDKYAGQHGAMLDIPEGGSFADMVKLKNDKEIGDKINKIIAKLADANDLKGVIDQADFNDENLLGRGKDMWDRLTNLIGIFEGLDLRANRPGGDDLLGDAYEYLMRHFATESGKSKGQFYTPAEVSRVMAKVVGIGSATRADQTIYDPTCGSGSLLLKAADEAKAKITIYGQEMDNATWSLARMNMILHSHETAELEHGNTLAAPQFIGADGGLKTFDFAVANPPFSQKNWTNGLDPAHDEYGRFAFGVPPAKNGDYAFLLHIIKSLKSSGKGAVILPHGVLFRGNAEADIRRNLVRRGLIKGIIGLPPNLFYGTGIPACIIVIDKEGAQARTGIFMIDASRGFIKDGNKNRLREQDMRKIVDVFTASLEVPRYSRMVPTGEIEANGFNLNIPRYIDSSDAEDLHDLEAHLRGGIPQRDVDELRAYWEVVPSLRAALFEPGDRPGYLAGRVDPRELKRVIQDNPDFQAYADDVRAVFKTWRAAQQPRLSALTQGTHPGEVIRTIGDDLLARFADLPLLDTYDIYQRLMNYWDETMQDDLYLISTEGWVEAARPRLLVVDKGSKSKETPDLEVDRQKFKTDLIPPALIVARYLAAEQAELERLQADADTAASELEAFTEEHGGEEGLLAGATTDADKVTAASAKARLKELKQAHAPDDDEERAVLSMVLALFDAKAQAESKAKDAKITLTERTLKQYGLLSEGDIKRLVIEDKWLTTLQTTVEDEVGQVAQHLTTRVKELEERYAAPLPEIEAEVDALSERVTAHLARMGVAWQ